MWLSKFLAVALLALVSGTTMTLVASAQTEVRSTTDYPDNEQSSETAGFALITSTSKKSYEPVEPVTLSVALKNQRDKDTPYWTWNKFYIFKLSVVAPNGKQATLTEYGQQQMDKATISRSTVRYALKPGDAVTASFVLNRVFDMTLSGEYKILVESSMPSTNDLTKWEKINSKVTSISVGP